MSSARGNEKTPMADLRGRFVLLRGNLSSQMMSSWGLEDCTWMQPTISFSFLASLSISPHLESTLIKIQFCVMLNWLSFNWMHYRKGMVWSTASSSFRYYQGWSFVICFMFIPNRFSACSRSVWGQLSRSLALNKLSGLSSKGIQHYPGPISSNKNFTCTTFIHRSDTLRIEYAMRNGQRKLEMMRDPRVSGMGRLGFYCPAFLNIQGVLKNIY